MVNNKFFRVISLMLAAVMLIPCAGLSSAKAASPTYEKEEFTYVVFGDSFTRGMGCSETWEQDVEPEYDDSDHQTRNVKGSYSYLVAQALGCDTETANNWLEESDATYWPLVQNGQQISGVLDCLGIDDGYYDSEFYHSSDNVHELRYNRFVRYFGNPDSVTGENGETYGKYGSVYDARELIRKADLITLQLGMGDVLSIPVMRAAEKYLGGELSEELNLDNVDAGAIAAFTSAVVQNMYEGYAYFLRAYPILLEYLKETNQDGEIVILSFANPAFGVNLSDDIMLPIGTAFSAITALCNESIRKWAEEYDLIYVDISNVDTSSTDNDLTLIEDIINDGKKEVATHPSANGHAQIARQILAAYENRNKSLTDDIVLDLGRFETVDVVLLDGQTLSSNRYTVKDHLLTIKNPGKMAGTLTLVVRKGKRDAAFSVYQLSYDRRIGYSAYRIYTTNSAAAVIRSFATLPWNVTRKIIGLLK